MLCIFVNLNFEKRGKKRNQVDWGKRKEQLLNLLAINIGLFSLPPTWTSSI